jgi:hypothetical protein
MISRVVTGPINGPDGSPLAAGVLKARPLSPLAEGTIFISPEMLTAEIAAGDVALTLVAPAQYDFWVVNTEEATVWQFQALLDDSAVTDISLAQLFLSSVDGCQAAMRGYLLTGLGSPEGVVTSSPGVLYLNLSGGPGVTLFVKESGTGSTGWVAK